MRFMIPLFVVPKCLDLSGKKGCVYDWTVRMESEVKYLTTTWNVWHGLSALIARDHKRKIWENQRSGLSAFGGLSACTFLILVFLSSNLAAPLWISNKSLKNSTKVRLNVAIFYQLLKMFHIPLAICD